MKKILLTGGTGFLGSHLAHGLLDHGEEVIILKRRASNTWRINDILDKVACFDVDADGLEKVFKNRHIDVLIHTACCYGRKGETASAIADTNLMLGLNLFELCGKYKTTTFINTGTLLPEYLNPYSLSKKQFVDWLKKLAGAVRVINMRPEHMYGPKDDDTKFVSWIIKQLKNNEKHIKLTSGEQERDFIYISDIVSAYLTVLEQSGNFEKFTEFDIGTGTPIKVRDFVAEIERQYKEKHKESTTELVFGALSYREGEAMKVTVNTGPLAALGWHAGITMQDGISSLL